MYTFVKEIREEKKNKKILLYFWWNEITFILLQNN